MQRLSKAEAMIQSHEHKLAVECPTSAVISKKRVVPQVAKVSCFISLVMIYVLILLLGRNKESIQNFAGWRNFCRI